MNDPIFQMAAALKFWIGFDRFLFLRYLIAFFGFDGTVSEAQEYL